MSIFILAICHLFNFNDSFPGLAFDDLFRRDADLPILGIANDQLHEFRMVSGIIEKREIR